MPPGKSEYGDSRELVLPSTATCFQKRSNRLHSKRFARFGCGCDALGTARPTLLGALLLVVLLSLPGCARFESRPISAEKSAAALESRNLDSVDLEQFLKRNLDRDISEWPPKAWDLEMLTFAGFYYHPSLAVARAQWAVTQGGEVTAGQRPNPVGTAGPS